ncbi:hypothetical protein Slin15195_G059570 [Septoria linicola]|uniref:Uncharacterized protein n=1 Tax=Septoria linicola TaxID=215465 RepID=A0A9Q9EKQ9_9PEZI|nr:hypothetical protein Slin14017_G075430 [Septoria linicola]USW52638.1 hypothetical protein Slin15195_G059570 [Septoria linicola]
MFPVTKRKDSVRGAGLLLPSTKSFQADTMTTEPRSTATTARSSQPLDRRSRRIKSITTELCHNTHYRGRFTSGTIIGWYTHPSLWEKWANRKFRAYRKIYKKAAPRLPRLSAAVRTKYRQLVQGRISTDFILTDFEQGLLRGGVARDAAAAAARETEEGEGGEGLEERTEGETQLEAILRALKPATTTTTAAVSTQSSAAIHPDRLAMMSGDDDGDERVPVGTDYDAVLRAQRQQWLAERHNRQLEKETIRETGESMWTKPGEDYSFLGEAEGREGGMLG